VQSTGATSSERRNDKPEAQRKSIVLRHPEKPWKRRASHAKAAVLEFRMHTRQVLFAPIRLGGLLVLCLTGGCGYARRRGPGDKHGKSR
jgi:hypothetical protein